MSALALMTTSAHGASPYAQRILSTPGLHSYLRLNEAPSVAIRDLTRPPARPVHWAGSSVIFGRPGAILGDPGTSFQFVDSYWGGAIRGPDFPRPGRNPFSLEAWVKPGLTDTTSRRIFSQENEVGGYLLGLKSSGLVFARYLTTGSFRRPFGSGMQHFWQQADWDVARSGPLSGTSWHHVVAVFDGGTLRLYVNGAVVSTENSTLGLEPYLGGVWNRPFAIGARSDGFVGFDGSIDEAASYERELSPSEVLDHYETGIMP